MNVSSTQTQTQIEPQQTQKLNEQNQKAGAESVSSAQSEEKIEQKNTNEKSEFQKFLEEPQATDKVVGEQQVQNVNMGQNIPVDENYANKFGFDVVSGFKNLKSLYNYDSMSISKDDAKFFVDLVENKQFAVKQEGQELNLIKFADEVGPTYKSQQTSQILTNLISKAYNEQKPIRIDFDNNVSVILKVDNKGKVSAEFIPGDKAVEAYLRNNIGFLKQRFDEQNLPYNDLMYRQSGQNKQHRERQQQQNKGE